MPFWIESVELKLEHFTSVLNWMWLRLSLWPIIPLRTYYVLSTKVFTGNYRLCEQTGGLWHVIVNLFSSVQFLMGKWCWWHHLAVCYIVRQKLSRSYRQKIILNCNPLTEPEQNPCDVWIQRARRTQHVNTITSELAEDAHFSFPSPTPNEHTRLVHGARRENTDNNDIPGTNISP